ncbi:MAG: chromate efflux transporter [Rhodothermales bacterium]
MESERTSLMELARHFFRLGLIAFGGPAAHIAMMEDEFVTRRQWLSREHFLDLVGATNLIPGPNSTEMTMHIGYERAGWPGLFVAGASFIFPAAVLTGLLAWLYVTYGTLPAVEPFLYGIKPAVISVILGAIWKLGGKAVKDWRFAVLGVAVAASVLLGLNEIQALFAGGFLGMVWFRAPGSAARGAFLPLLPQDSTAVAAGSAAAGVAAGVSLTQLGLYFLKIGAILYGSGYVLIAFLEGGLVDDLGWISRSQLLDAIAMGQFTPGPVLTTATFLGYVISGAPGAVVATLGIFLPSFIFVLILNPIIPKLRRSPWTAAFLDAVNVAAIALMAAVVVQLGMETLVSWRSVVIAAAAAVLVVRYKTNAAWIVLGGAVAGWLLLHIGG